MTSVAVLEKDQVLRSLVVRELALRGYDVASFSSQEDAIERARSGRVDILVSRLNGDEEGWGLLSALNEKVPHVRPIIMAGEDVFSQSERVQQLGAVEVLPYPLVEGQLVDAVERAENACQGFSGWIHGVSLIDLLQIFHYGKRTLTLTVEREGVLQFVEGEVVDARYRGQEGEEAVRAILQLEHGRIRTSEGSSHVTTVHRSFQSLLLDCLRELDEDARDRSAQNEDDWVEANGESQVVRISEGAQDAQGSVRPSLRPSFLPGQNPHEVMLGGICRDLIGQVEGAKAALVIHLKKSQVLASEAMPLGASEALVALVTRFFSGASFAAVEDAAFGGDTVTTSPDEMRVATRGARYLARKVSGRDVVLLLVTNQQAASALCSAGLRQAVKTIERILP